MQLESPELIQGLIEGHNSVSRQPSSRLKFNRVSCLVPRRRFSAGKKGARGVVGRMQNAEARRPKAVHLSHDATRTIIS